MPGEVRLSHRLWRLRDGHEVTTQTIHIPPETLGALQTDDRCYATVLLSAERGWAYSSGRSVSESRWPATP
jgi:hypothetical protein